MFHASIGALIGGSRGRVAGIAPPFGRKILPIKWSFWVIFRTAPPFPGRKVEKSSHERLQPPPPPLSKISRSAYGTDTMKQAIEYISKYQLTT